MRTRTIARTHCFETCGDVAEGWREGEYGQDIASLRRARIGGLADVILQRVGPAMCVGGSERICFCAGFPIERHLLDMLSLECLIVVH